MRKARHPAAPSFEQQKLPGLGCYFQRVSFEAPYLSPFTDLNPREIGCDRFGDQSSATSRNVASRIYIL